MGTARMARPTYEQLLEIIAAKDRQITQLQTRVTQREARIVPLERLLEKATRDGKRQAAPFSKGSPKEKPKMPGRKSGTKYGLKAHRPLPEQEPDEIVDVPTPEQCDECGGTVEEDHVDQQFQMEIPRRPIVRRFDIHVGTCRCCGKRFRPRHALQTSDAVGAAASQLGPDLQAMIATMKDKYGLSYGAPRMNKLHNLTREPAYFTVLSRKQSFMLFLRDYGDICGLLKDGFGIPITRGGAAQAVLRAGVRARPLYEVFKQLVRCGDVVYPDETGWKVGGLLQWMWAFVTDTVTIYVIRPSRGKDVPREILGADYNGRMIHDGWSPYDSFERAIHQQCLEHLLRRATELQEKATGTAARCPNRVKKFLQDSLALRDRRDAGKISEHGLAVARGHLETRLDRLLNSRCAHAGNRRFRNHLAKHRQEILTFLYHRDIEATNWPAEQAIRPAVRNRKIFGGNRTGSGAAAQESLGSFFVTCGKNAIAPMDTLSRIICRPMPTA